MNDKPGPGTGAIVAGTFLILFGLCLVLFGGGCSLIMFAEPGGLGGLVGLVLFFALIGLAAGFSLIWLGVKLMKGDFSR